MTPKDCTTSKNSIQLQMALRMFLEYLLEHKEVLKTGIQEHRTNDGDSVIREQQAENVSVPTKYSCRKRRDPATSARK